MRRVIRLALVLVLVAIPAFGQGTRQDGVAIRSSAGFGGATVRVCTAAATGTPCSPLASIFSDRLLTVALTNPLTADVNGNYNFYAAPGRYVVQVTSGTNTLSMADVVVPPDVSGPVTFTGTLITPSIGPSATQQHTLPAVASDTVALLAATQTLTNKTLTSPTISTILNTGTLTLPTSTDTLVGKATSDTLTNKTLTSPTVNGGALSGAVSAKLGAIGTPSAPTVTVNGTTGATSYTYFCVARDVNNIQTLASTGTTITNGNATLSVSNFNAVTCGPKAGAVSYDILKTTTATLLGNVAAANAGASVTLNDTGQSTSAYTAAASDLTGSLSVPGTASFTGPGTHSGTETFKYLNNIRFADQFAGADCGAKINAADADLGATIGEIWLNQGCGTTISTAFTLSAGHILRVVQGANYSLGAQITIKAGAGILGIPNGMNPATSGCGNAVVCFTTTAALNPAILMNGQQSFVSGFTLVGNNVGVVGISDTYQTSGIFAGRKSIEHVFVNSFTSHGISNSSSSFANDEACCTKIFNSSSINNGGSGLFWQNSTDLFVSMSELENNSRYGMEISGGSGLRVEQNDISGNVLGGVFQSCTTTPNNPSQRNTFIGNELINKGYQFFVKGADQSTNLFCGGYNIINGNRFPGIFAGGAANTYDAVHFEDSQGNVVVGNFVQNSAASFRYAFRVVQNVGRAAGRDTFTSNELQGGFGTGYFLSDIPALTAFYGNDENLSQYSLFSAPYLNNNVPIKAKDNSGGLTSLFNLGADNNLYVFGHPTQKTIVFQPGPGTSRVMMTDSATTPLTLNGNAASQTIASGTATMTTAAITAGNCGTTVTVAATGVATTDAIEWAFNAAPAGSNAGLVAWPTLNNVNFAYCPNSAETPAAATINWRVVR